jgi:DnaJ-class molecular chaperone
MYDRFLRNFTGLGVPKSERIEGLNIEVLLTRSEAAAGCAIPIGLPAFQRCPRCRGSGMQWSYPCAHCRQSGMIEREQVIHVQIPPVASPGAVYEVALRGLGIRNFALRVHVVVESGPDHVR